MPSSGSRERGSLDDLCAFPEKRARFGFRAVVAVPPPMPSLRGLAEKNFRTLRSTPSPVAVGQVTISDWRKSDKRNVL